MGLDVFAGKFHFPLQKTKARIESGGACFLAKVVHCEKAFGHIRNQET